MSRLAIRGDDADRDAIVGLLARVANAYDIAPEPVERAIERDIVAISESRKAAIRLVKARGVNVIDIPWWLWDGTGAKLATGAPVELMEAFVLATDEALKKWDCAKWVIGGVAIAGGKTPIEMQRRSKLAADQWPLWFGGVGETRRHESNYWYAWSTVGAINRAARAVLLAG